MVSRRFSASRSLGGLRAFLGLVFFVTTGASTGGVPGGVDATTFRYAHPSSIRLEIDGRELGLCFAKASHEIGPVPTLDRSRMLLRVKGVSTGQSAPFTSHDMMEYLEANKSRKGDYETGTESALRDWVLAQPEASIDPVSIFRKSMELNGANLWNAVLAIHQLLRLEARWWSSWYDYPSSVAAQERFFNRFIDIRGDLKERAPLPGKDAFTGDHAGSWYRFWGMILYRMADEDDADFSSRVRGRSVPMCFDGKESWDQELGLKSADWDAIGTASAAEWVKPLLGLQESDWRKAEINTAGAEIGSTLVRSLRVYSPFDLGELSGDCGNPDTYLRKVADP